ncbi:MAG: glycosyltransferase family 39 protein [Nocardioides sp.]|uniref:glycosyltransferase family 39 protein n=1 Tax=Nocardioides sp. TaxID=35761 RepID=UPI0039E65138
MRRQAELLLSAVPSAILVLLDRPALAKARWSDEWATWQFSGLSWHQLWQATSHVDRALLPYYAVVHVVRDLGGTIAAVRLLSLACGVAAIVCAQLVARRIWGRVAALTTGVVLAVNPVFCLWSAQARPPALGYLAVALGTLLVVRWTRVSRVAHPVVVTVGTLLFPPTAVAVVPHLVWRWRTAGPRTALVTVAPAVLGVAGVGLWGLSWRDQAPALLVASHSGLHDVLGSLHTALGYAGWLPWLHAVALIAALVVVVWHRGERHAAARDGLVLAILLAEGTLGLAWAATAAGVPMMGDNLLVAIPIGAALLLGGLIGHDWFALTDIGTVAEGDPSVALRGGFALATALSLLFAGHWWIGQARSDRSADGAATVARDWSEVARAGDAVMLQQPYAAVGYLASIAAATHDPDLADALLKQLPHGAERVVVRRVAEVDPARSVVRTTAARPAGDAERLWLIRLPKDPVSRRHLAVLRCTQPEVAHARLGQTYLDLYTCGEERG